MVSNCQGDFGPVLRELAPAANGSAVSVSWSWPRNKRWSTSGGELLHYVLEWTSVPMAGLQWQKLADDQNSTFITGKEHSAVRQKNPSAQSTNQGTVVSTHSQAVTSCGELVNHTLIIFTFITSTTVEDLKLL